MDRMRASAVALVLGVLTGCGGGDGARADVEPLEGMNPLLMHEMATEAYALWDPASLQLVRVELVRGHRVDPARYDLDIRYTVRKVGEPTLTTHAAQAAQAAASADPAVAALAPQLRTLAATRVGDTAEFTDTIVLVPANGTWMPRRWAERQRAAGASTARVH